MNEILVWIISCTILDAKYCLVIIWNGWTGRRSEALTLLIGKREG